ncbi:MAG: galactose/methyl galactoside ABC transporter ATP-binding protein MglA [Bacillaceae bacterium]
MSVTNNQEQYILQMNGISKTFPGVKALDNVSLAIKPGTVHALMGENGAGKSTLMKCLFGIYHADSGEIIFDGKAVHFTTSKQALESGISMVHQELNQVKQQNILDNVWLGRYPRKGFFVDEEKMYRDTCEIFEKLGIQLDPKREVGTLSVSEMQMIEIAKAVSYDSKVIVMDEPTSSLTETEVNHLFRIIDTLKAQGISIIYISHKMEEILKISDEVTIMRDGQWIATKAASEITTEEIIRLMVGREINQRFPARTHQPGDMMLEVEGLTSSEKNSFKDVHFDVREGEIVGIAGLVGSKRTEVVESLFGLRPIKEGTISFKGKKITNKTPNQAMKNGFALVTEERRATGIFGQLGVDFNAVIANVHAYKNKAKLLSNAQITSDTNWVIDSMKVKTPSQQTLIGSLSGGNQQKVIIGRWLLTKPHILLLDEPTRGIDVGAKFEIYQLMNSLASEGKAVVVVSSEMPELLGMTDRIVVMSNGRVAGIVETAKTTQEEIMRLAALYE